MQLCMRLACGSNSKMKTTKKSEAEVAALVSQLTAHLKEVTQLLRDVG